jgi:RIO kinase 1
VREQESSGVPTRGRRRFDDDEPTFVKRRGGTGFGSAKFELEPDGPPTGDRWSSWDASGVLHGPDPRPAWVLTELAAVDTELGILKTGKEADVHLVERGVPGTDRTVLLAAKRYRAPEHRLFHRDAGYLDGRRVRESRVNRAVVNRTAFGREAIAGQWAAAEFAALSRLWQIGAEIRAAAEPPEQAVGHAPGVAGAEVGGINVPYPVQLLGTELMLEFIGDSDGAAAPRLAQLRPDRDELAGLWRQLVDALTVLARAGLAHGDLSPFNLLVDRGRLVIIDLPQVVDVVSNPAGRDFLVRDAHVVSKWFAARGLPLDEEALIDSLLADAGLR